MVMITTQKGSFGMDGYLISNLDIAKNVVTKDWDMIFAVDGGEGAGKSVIAQQIAWYCDNSLDISRITFNPEEFKKAVLKAKQYQAVIYDEAYSGLSSRSTMSDINKALVQMLAEIRQKNLFVFVVLPSFFDLDKYVSLWRSRALIHVYTGDNFERGFFAFYNADLKKQLYINGKKTYSYSYPKPNFVARFSNFYTVDEKEYREKKRDSLNHHVKNEKEDNKIIEQELFKRLQEIGEIVPHNVKRQILKMPEATYFRKLKQFKELRADSEAVEL